MTIVLKHLQAIILLPLTMALIIPSLIVYLTGSVNVGWSLPAPVYLGPVICGLLLIGFGLMLGGKTISLFVTAGHGTLAPWDPPQKLVVRGIYRQVRNPMISGIFAILLGEAVLLGSGPLLTYSSLFLLVNLIYIPLFEEPGLERRFGADYALYRQHVPRWIPRLRPWSPLSAGESKSEQP